VLYGELNADIAAADILIQPETVDLEREFGVVLEKCFSQAPATFIRTNDALHLASAKLAGELEFVTGDVRQRTAALLLGFTVLP
jgi:predicted nucleic acid-binding protein